jgi:hypothetical protein
MAYRRPGIRVTQEFLDLLPALAPFNLPNCVVGPAYQVVQDDEVGSYTGIAGSYSYAGLNAGNIVDINKLDENELTDHQYPIKTYLKEIESLLLEGVGLGYVASDLTLFKNDSVDAFSSAVAGDILVVIEDDIEIVPEASNGSADSALPNVLTGPSSTVFNDVAEGDKVIISAGTDVTAGEYTVSSIIDGQNIELSASFYTGLSSVSDITYQVVRTTGTNNAGRYIIREVVDNNTVKLQSEFSEEETLLSYSVLREVDEVELTRDTDFTADEDSINLLSGLTANGLDVVSAKVFASYRALRIDLASSIREYKSLTDIQAVFGVDQVVPANPLAFGLSIALQNTVTAANGLGLGVEFLTNEQQAYQKALDVLKKTDMYALVPLTQSPVVAQLFSSHVTQMSLPEIGKERVAITNKKLTTTEILADTTTTSGQRTIVNTKLAGIVVLGASTLSFSSDLFGNVQAGDVVTIVGGTGVAPGDYVVDSVDSATQLTLDSFTATYNGSDVQFYISRADGIEANGIVFYDGSSTFLTDGVAAGHFLIIESGSFAGKHKITAVNSEQKISVEQIPGIVSVQDSIEYRIEKDLTATEMAEFAKAYAAAFANRRLVIAFPDTVKIPEGSVVKELPGFYLGCSVGALTTGLPTHQGFTNLSVSGFLGLVNGSDRFDEEQLDTIADGGTMIFDQEVPEAPLFIRHELTSDRSAIKFQEYMVTKNVDFIAKFMRNAFKDFIGTYNIVDTTFDDLKLTSTSVIRYLKDETILPKIGGVIKGGNLTKLEEGTNIDTILMRFKLDIPIPLNNIDITVQV